MPERTDQRTIDDVEDEDLGSLDDDFGGLDDDVDVEVGADPASEYDHLVDGEPGTDTASDDESGVLGGLFGGEDETSDRASQSDGAEDSGGFLARLVGGSFSLRAFAVAFVASTLLVGIATTFIPIVEVVVGVPLGLVIAAFLGGLVSGTSRYAEFALTGTIIGVPAVLLGDFPLELFVDTGIPPAVGGVGIGLLIGLLATIVGHYFGRDLRIGLTKDVGG